MTKATLKASDIMQRQVISLSPDISLIDAYNKLSQHKISGAPVVDEEGRVVGVVSQTDLLKRSYKTEFDEFPSDVFYVGMPFAETPGFHEVTEQLRLTPIFEVMNTNVMSVSPDDTVDLMAIKMRSEHIHRLVVVEDGKLKGIVTTFDLLKLLENQ